MKKIDEVMDIWKDRWMASNTIKQIKQDNKCRAR